MKGCELCKFPARMYCESDQASLCWDCDAKVHSANFLVARHSRSLLCHVCQSPTPWKASGAKLGPTVSVCERCVDGCDGRNGRCVEEEESEGGGNDDEIDTEDDDLDEDDEGDEFSVDDEEGDNQVVPWSSTPPPPSTSSSSSEDSSSGGERDVSLKRKREIASDLRSDFDLGCSTSQRNRGAASAGDGDVDSFRASKDRRIEPDRSPQVHPGSRSAAIVDSLRRLHQQDIGKLSNGPKAVDFDSCESP